MNTKLAIEAIRKRLMDEFKYELSFVTRKYEKIKDGGDKPVYKKLSIPFKNRIVKGVLIKYNTKCIGITFAVVYGTVPDNPIREVITYGTSYCSSDDKWNRGNGRYEAAKRAIRMVLGREVRSMGDKLDFSSCPQLAGINILDGGII